MDVDFSHLTLVQVIVTLFAIAFLDFVCAVGAAIRDHTFEPAYVGEWIGSHILSRVIPLSVAAAIGMGIARIDLQPIPAIWALFLIAAAAYVVETLASIAGSFGIRPKFTTTNVVVAKPIPPA